MIELEVTFPLTLSKVLRVPGYVVPYYLSCVCVGLCKRTYEARYLVFGGTLFLTWDSKVCVGGAKRSCPALTPRECHSRIHPSRIARLSIKPRAAFRIPSVGF